MEQKYTFRDLEKCLIPFHDWEKHKDNIPIERWNDINEEGGGPIGLGYKEDIGYFIMFSGQGPCLGWMEHEENRKKVYGNDNQV